MLTNYIVGPVAILYIYIYIYIEREREREREREGRGEEACLFLSFCMAGKPTLSSWLDYINIVR